MSSFNLNNIPGSQPIIQSAQSLGKDGGGGGNAGYMNMRNKKKKDDKKNENGNDNEKTYLFEEGEADTFEREEDSAKKNKPKKNFR